MYGSLVSGGEGGGGGAAESGARAPVDTVAKKLRHDLCGPLECDLGLRCGLGALQNIETGVTCAGTKGGEGRAPTDMTPAFLPQTNCGRRKPVPSTMLQDVSAPRSDVVL
jgi:hypothetical protein